MVDDIRAPRGQRRDYTGEIIGRQPGPPKETPAPPAKKVKKSKRKLWVFGILSLLILIGVGAGGWLYAHRSTSPVPKGIQSAVSFPVYYPDQKKLPAGYTLDTNSFSAGQDAVIYKLNYSDNKNILVSVQQKPSSTDIQTFYSNNMPLHTNVSTPVGTATIGAIGKQTVVSLLTNGNSWLLMTAPSDINQGQLKQVLQSFKA